MNSVTNASKEDLHCRQIVKWALAELLQQVYARTWGLATRMQCARPRRQAVASSFRGKRTKDGCCGRPPCRDPRRASGPSKTGRASARVRAAGGAARRSRSTVLSRGTGPRFPGTPSKSQHLRIQSNTQEVLQQ